MVHHRKDINEFKIETKYPINFIFNAIANYVEDDKLETIGFMMFGEETSFGIDIEQFLLEMAKQKVEAAKIL